MDSEQADLKRSAFTSVLFFSFVFVVCVCVCCLCLLFVLFVFAVCVKISQIVFFPFFLLDFVWYFIELFCFVLFCFVFFVCWFD